MEPQLLARGAPGHNRTIVCDGRKLDSERRITSETAASGPRTAQMALRPVAQGALRRRGDAWQLDTLSGAI